MRRRILVARARGNYGIPPEIIKEFVGFEVDATGPMTLENAGELADSSKSHGEQRVFAVPMADVLEALKRAGKKIVCDWLAANTNALIVFFPKEDCDVIRTIPGPKWTEPERLTLALELINEFRRFLKGPDFHERTVPVPVVYGILLRIANLMERDHKWLEGRRDWILYGKDAYPVH